MKRYFLIFLIILFITSRGICFFDFSSIEKLKLPVFEISKTEGFPFFKVNLQLTDLIEYQKRASQDFDNNFNLTDWLLFSLFSIPPEPDDPLDETADDTVEEKSEESGSDEDTTEDTSDASDDTAEKEDEELTEDQTGESIDEATEDSEDIVEEEIVVSKENMWLDNMLRGKYYKAPQYSFSENIQLKIDFHSRTRTLFTGIKLFTKSRNFNNFSNYWKTLNNITDKTFRTSLLDNIKNRQRLLQETKNKEFFEMDEGLVPDINLPSESKIEISGRKMVSVGYVRQSYEGYSYYGSGDGSSGNIDMEQELQIKVKGTIARKTTVSIDYDDTRENENRNMMSIVYSGDEDEFVQEAAFGDINLSLPSTDFISFSSSRSVFGGKGTIQKGPFEFMGIASREKGKTEEESFSGGSEFTTNRIYDYQYSKRRYFVLNYGDRDLDEPNFFSDSNRKIEIKPTGEPYLQIYVYSGYTDDPDTYDVVAYKYQEYGDENREEKDESERFPEAGTQPDFEKLTVNDDYEINVETGVVTFKTNISEDDVIAVCYKVADSNNNRLYSVGYTSEGSDTVDLENLKIIKPEDIKRGPPDYFEFYEFVNIYSLGSQNIPQQDFLIKLMNLNGEETDELGEPYIQKYGLDENQDGEIDSKFINLTDGLLQLPGRVPFDYDKEINPGVIGEDAYYPGVIDSKLYFYVEYYAVSNIIILRSNIIPDSEEVRINGVLQQRDVDYWIDYDTGYIEFFTEEINDPTANVSITYEYQPFFANLSKTLAGGRVEFELGEQSHLGSTFIGEWTSKPLEGDIPDLSSTPTTQNVFGADLHLEYKPQFLTNFVDNIPLIETDYPSKFMLEVETARSFINPNIIGSAEVDNMEGIKISPSFPMRENAWMHSSHPEVTYQGIDYKENSRVLLNIQESQTSRNNIYGGNFYSTTDFIYFLSLSNLPTQPFPESGDISPGELERWGGIMRVVSATGMDYIEKEYEYLELLINLNAVSGGRLHIDLGEISEDADADNNLDTEDTGDNPDGILNPGEDVGWNYDNTSASPPGNDVIPDYGAGNNILDTEDLDRDNFLDISNNYFGYSVDLEEVIFGTSEYLTSDLGTGWYVLRIPLNMDSTTRDTTWDYGEPDGTNIKAVRVWVEATDDDDFRSTSSIYIAGIAPVGNRWDPAEVSPEKGFNTAEIDIVSNKTDEYYVPIKQTQTSEGYTEEEASLALLYNLSEWDDFGYIPGDDLFDDDDMSTSLQLSESLFDSNNPEIKNTGRFDDKVTRRYGEGDGILNTEDRNHNGILDEGEDVGWIEYGYPGELTGANNGRLDSEDELEAYTEYQYPYQPEDFTDYRYIKLDIYRYISGTWGDIFYIRFGSDDNNYFEYVQSIDEIIANPDPDSINPGWGLVKIDLYKYLDMQSNPKIIEHLNSGKKIQIGHYVIKGDPKLYNINKIILGVKSTIPSKQGQSDTHLAEIWINEMQLTDVDMKDGWAKRVQLDTTFADFITLGGDFKTVDSNFSSIGSLSTSKQQRTTFGGNLNVEISKLMPIEWKVSLPLSFTYNKSTTQEEDRYEPGKSIYSFGKIESGSKRLTLGLKRRWLPTINFSYYDSYSLNKRYAREIRNKSYSLSGSYNFPKGLVIVPSNVTLSYKHSNSKTDYNDPTVIGSNSSSHTDNISTSVRFEPMDKFEIRPSFAYSYSHNDLDDVEISYSENYGFYTSFSKITGLRPSFSYSSRYSETFDDDESTYDVSNSSSITSSFQFELGRMLGLKSGFSSISISPSYSLNRYSNYYDLNFRPGFKYKFGYDPILHIPEEPYSANFGHSFTLRTKFRPLEYFSKFEDKKNLDCITAGINYSYSFDTQFTTGSKTRSKTITFPDVNVRIDGTSNFPIAAKWLKRSSVIVDYSKRISETFEYYRSIKHTPGLSWRATWSDSLKTTFDFNYTYQKDIDFSQQELVPDYEPKVTKIISPSITVNYDMKLSKGETIPILSKIFRFRNELDMQGTLTYSRTRYSGEYSYEDLDRWTFNLSAGYYLTSNLHLTISSTYSKYNYLEQTTDHSSLSFYATFEALF